MQPLESTWIAPPNQFNLQVKSSFKDVTTSCRDWRCNRFAYTRKIANFVSHYLPCTFDDLHPHLKSVTFVVVSYFIFKIIIHHSSMYICNEKSYWMNIKMKNEAWGLKERQLSAHAFDLRYYGFWLLRMLMSLWWKLLRYI